MNPVKNTSDSCICPKTSCPETKTQILKCDMVDGRCLSNPKSQGTPRLDKDENPYDNERFLYDGGW